jgi:hypothetical protein
LSGYEPACKVFILGVKDSPADAEIEAYKAAHPFTQDIELVRKSCR